MAYTIGLDALLKYGVAGSTAGTTLDDVQDVTMTGELSTIERIRRGKKWRAKKPVLHDAKLEFEILSDPTKAGYTSLKSAYTGKTAVALAALDDQGHGLDADFYITGFSRNEPVEGDLTYSIVADISDELRDPTWV